VGLDTTPLDRLFRNLSSVTDLTLIYESKYMPVTDFPSLFPLLVDLEMKIGQFGLYEGRTLRRLKRLPPKMENLRYLSLGFIPNGYRWGYSGAGWGSGIIGVVVKGCVVDLEADGWEDHDDSSSSEDSDGNENEDEFDGEDEGEDGSEN
jgi:hypothetical protein